jgi:Arc/MetJ family transcription regulator
MESSMATNVELDEELVARAMALSPARSKRALLEEALKAYIRYQEQKEVRDLRGRLRWENPK